MSQDKLTRDTVDAQFCSDWLKGQVKALFDRVEDLESGLEAIKCLNKFTLIGDHESYSDGAHNAFCQASEMAEEYLRG